ncbi:hypothetical protein LIER_08229 [Lithospermum erythrorhizon]|uniref:DUF4283 domain-containing protein n=1 Tax=Lithospermum erythrorhizon TaxID=34254 RepID=A0AAV3PCT3_LITER
MVNWGRDVDPTTIDFDTCDFWIHVRGLKGKFLTRDVARNIGNAFQGCKSVELRVDKQGKKFFRLKETVMIHQPIRRLASFKVGSSMVSSENCTTKVVYGIWIKAPLERSWIHFKLMDESAVQRSTSMGDRARLQETREGEDNRREVSFEPRFSPNKLLQIRGEDLVAKDLVGGEIFSEEVAELQASAQVLVGHFEADPILEEENTEKPLGDPQSKDHQPNGPMSLQAEGSVRTQLAIENSDIRNEALALFNFKSTVGSSTKGKAQMLKPQSKKRHHPYQGISNGEGRRGTQPFVHYPEADGRKEGLALLWDRKLDVSVKSFYSHHIEAVIEEGTGNTWRFVGFYGHHEVTKRKFSWELMRHIDSLSQLPTMFIGDFNEILKASEHVSQRRSRPIWQMNNFNQAVMDCGMFDIRCKGYPYTWSNKFIAPFSTRARLDRALAS